MCDLSNLGKEKKMCLLLKQLCSSCERRCEMCWWETKKGRQKVADVRELHREEETIGKLLVETDKSLEHAHRKNEKPGAGLKKY